jgi:hypothetical protein
MHLEHDEVVAKGKLAQWGKWRWFSFYDCNLLRNKFIKRKKIESNYWSVGGADQELKFKFNTASGFRDPERRKKFSKTKFFSGFVVRVKKKI